MQSIAYIKGSDGTANASLATVTTARSALATEMLVNTVTGWPTGGFFASMGTPHNFTDPVTGETITIISDATAVDFAGHISSGKIEIDAIAPGMTDAGSKVGDIVVIKPSTEWANNIYNILSQSLNDNGSIKNSAIIYNPSASNYFASGCVWTADAVGSTLRGSMTSGVVYINGARLTVAAITAHAFTASKDTYIDFQDNGDGTAKVIYTEVTNNASAPAIPNSLTFGTDARNAKIVTGTSSIATVASIVQYGFDTLTTSGQVNYIYNTNPAAAPVYAYSTGGTFYYRTTAGVIEFWGVTTPSTYASGNNNVNITLPSGLFHTLQSVQAQINNAQVTGNQFCNAGVCSTTTLAFNLYSANTITVAEQVGVYVRGI